MSMTVHPVETDQIPPPSETGPGGDGSAASIDQRIVYEQVHLLFSMGKAGSFTLFLGIVAMWLPYYPYVSLWTLLPPLMFQATGQALFWYARHGFERDPDAIHHPEVWGDRYACISVLTGLTWGSAAVLWMPGTPVQTQSVLVLAIMTLCIASAFSRHGYPKAMLVYGCAVYIPAAVTIIADGILETQIAAGLGLIVLATASMWTRDLHQRSTETIRLRFENADLIRQLGTSTKVARQKQADAERAQQFARSAARSRRDFLGMITHEIRTPLASLSGLARILEETELSPKQTSYAHGISASTDLLDRLVEDLTDLTEMEAQTLKLRPVDLSPSEIAKSAVQLLRLEAKQKGLSIEFDELPHTPATIFSDPDRLRQVLINLISRAVRVTEYGGVVVRLSPVHLKANGRGVRFSVTDTGEGMSQEQASRMFRSTGEPERGTTDALQDVSLTICDRLVGLMKGKMGADARADAGATFWFTLPCDLRVDPPPQEVRTIPATSGQVLDLAKVYEVEQQVGTGRIADHLLAVLDLLSRTQQQVLAALAAGDRAVLVSAAAELADQSQKIGLTGLAEAAASIADLPPELLQDSAEQCRELTERLASGTKALARAYPGLTGPASQSTSQR